MIAALAIGWGLAVTFAIIALVCALKAGDRLWERDDARRERDKAVADLQELRAGQDDEITQELEATFGPQQLIADADHSAGMTDLDDTEVDARFQDLLRHNDL